MKHVTISIGDVYSTVINGDNESRRILRLIAKARPDGYEYMPRYKSGMWDGYISLLKTSTEFPTGLLGIYVSNLRSNGYKVYINWNDNNVDASYNVNADILNGVVLRNYQTQAIRDALKSTRGILEMATNSGKTEIIAAMCMILKCNCIVIVNTVDLLHQTASRLEYRMGEYVGKIGDGVWDMGRVTVATIQTLYNSRARLPSCLSNIPQALFIDECHHGSSNQYLDVVYKLPGMYRYGFSGTPLNGNELADLKLMSSTGRVIYTYNNIDMINAGYSTSPQIYMIDVPDSGNAYNYTYARAYDDLIVDNAFRNNCIVDIAYKHMQHTTVLIIVKRVRHGHILQRMINGSAFVHGGIKSDTRIGVLNSMRTSNGVYIATSIFDEGIDVPSIGCLIMGGGGDTKRAVLQRLGRGLRKSDDNKCLNVYDFIDNGNKHLLRHSQHRMDVYSEHFQTQINTI